MSWSRWRRRPQRVTRVDGGTGSVAWVRLSVTPAAVARVARGLRPFPVPRITQVVVGAGRTAKDPNSYLRLFGIPAGAEVIRNPARRSKRHWIPVYLFSSRDSPWTDSSSSLAVGRRLDLIMRDGEIVRIPHTLAERIRHGESLR